MATDPAITQILPVENKTGPQDNALNPDVPEAETNRQGIRSGPTLWSAALFFALEQGFLLGTQADTRECLNGPYFKDYFEPLKSLGGSNDDDPPLANCVAHPMQGSTATWILMHNDPQGAPVVFGFESKPYWTSRLKGLGFSAAHSTFYELSIMGDAAVGNLGRNRDYNGVADLVITPTLGLGWHLTEDMLEGYFITWVEKKSDKPFLSIMVRTRLNPTPSLANILRFRLPWERETRLGVRGMKWKHQGGPCQIGLNRSPLQLRTRVANPSRRR